MNDEPTDETASVLALRLAHFSLASRYPGKIPASVIDDPEHIARAAETYRRRRDTDGLPWDPALMATAAEMSCVLEDLHAPTNTKDTP